VPDFNLENLTPYDFELLSRDLLQRELGIRLESFTAGRDRGIDFRYARTPGRDIIVQCKHYLASGFARLTRDLEQKELAKVRALAPSRYVLVTSVALTPDRKSTLMEVLKPFMRSPEDIIGADDIDNLLRRWPDVVRSNIKLWLTSVEVLSAVLNNGSYVRARGFEQELADRMKLYVPNSSFDDATSALEESHVCVITGVPGIGKSMLADMLVADYAARDYEPVFVSSDVAEAEALFLPDRAQVFYYDDFLGQTSGGERLRKNEDARLIGLLRQVRRASNKRFILTTRDYILEQAIQEHERFGVLARDFPRVLVSLAAYTRLIRGKILYNHLYFSDLSSEAIRSVVVDRQYMAIIGHRNYNPRLIEAVTALAASEGRDNGSFVRFAIDAFDNPERVWRHAFENQLDELGQAVVITLATLPPEVTAEELEVAVAGIVAARGGLAPTRRAFYNALRVLEGNFIRVIRVSNIRVVAFHNPSIRDFALLYLDENPDEVTRVVAGAYFFDQLLLLRRYAAEGQQSLLGQRVREFPGIRSVVSGDWVGFIDGLRRNFDSPTCGVQTSALSYAPDVSPRRSVSPERRFMTILAFSRRGELVPLEEAWMKKRLEELRNRWEERAAEKQEAVDLVEALRLCDGYELAAEELGRVVKNWVLQPRQDTDDWGVAATLKRPGVNLIDEDEFRSLVEEFEEWITTHLEEASATASSAAGLEGELDRANELADEYGVSLATLVDVDAIQGRIEELAAEEYEPDVDDDRPRSGGSEDGELNSLFGSLIDDS
jgi:hypothetical protein